ncbi:putative Cobalamin (vitamin B12) biosynthesis CobW-like [Vibrio nigripulchritudo SFn27]|uniref:Putative Cobalamin (Vitamin B12) biosynthesis CobW-like n=1 Tax=Vibrio nigripulchritudo TaxID=28173 RepID=U4KH58_9VIBR|nr:GTP-binding protein [Vibrio nigripulchritudo]CCN81595.1 putative Cobalamin (vitamin B12) biosynthesis CobW-like [Vibrio nigripulchritudo BLFn1]CCN91692.1 putative Cobalamin (vitamin B12) biosynthesis CobW-like [Vibrio nigripulchritudo SFn27]CCN96576.1 putative Cobalamin (vitamin B12) biosynthesis CobW-like [Vibrio nigripulchritudo ENn2]CCO38450.1 putative Cobalamin (vitamin B12) biosynthesis CobW-like [Vibrio nigripulchritudo SFn135]CCO53907.1 putative Cobalamin (vitamin B12) biosynthesis C
MSSDNIDNLGVPTNIITGFLGVGKTSAILHMMKNKPSNERWAVLVNEFGEIGVDGSLIQGNHDEKQQVFIREVPGGCMCCAAGLPMQIALNQLLSEAKPDRLLIEPTGLGHPKEVLQVLSSAHYRKVLSLQKNITLVDARKLSDSIYTQHDTFNQQIEIADTVVGHKLDLYQGDEKATLEEYVAKVGRPNTRVIFAQHGDIPFAEFEGKATVHSQPPHHHHHGHNKPLVSELPIPESGVLKATNQGEGFHSVGWRFSPEKIFNRNTLLALLAGLNVERMKAVFITESGIFGYNMTSDGLAEAELDDCYESRIELISTKVDESFESQLLGCVHG